MTFNLGALPLNKATSKIAVIGYFEPQVAHFEVKIINKSRQQSIVGCWHFFVSIDEVEHLCHFLLKNHLGSLSEVAR